MADALLGGIVINEILVDPNSATANYDTDGDGTAGAADEYVELYNASTVAIDISGLELWDATAGNWFTFPAGTVLQPGAHAIVITDALGGTGPTLGPDDYYFDADHFGALINNTGDAVVVYDPANDEYIQAVFNGYTVADFVDDGGLFSPTATLVGSGEDFGTAVEGYSIQRSPDGSDTFVNNQTPTAGTTNVCFCSGTLIATETGLRPVETLVVGDRVATGDGAFRPIRWIGKTLRSLREMSRYPHLRPVRIARGALGAGLPKRDLLVSRQHRLLVQGPIIRRIAGTEAALVPAVAFLGLAGVELYLPEKPLGFFHIVTDQHEVVFAEGVVCETMYLGKGALAALSTRARGHLCRTFSLSVADFAPPAPAFLLVHGAKAKEVIRCHAKNGKPIQGAVPLPIPGRMATAAAAGGGGGAKAGSEPLLAQN